MNYPEVARHCEKCVKTHTISLDSNSFVCSHCGHLNEYDNENLKRALDELLKERQKLLLKNKKNN